jgi:esterase/lipase superfamily enzyme
MRPFITPLFALSICCTSLSANSQPSVSARDVGVNSSLDAAMEAYVPRKTFGTRMKSKDILFITNREIDFNAEEKAHRSNSVLRIEDVFLKTPAIALTYGRVTVIYPANRKRGEQDYLSGSDQENPLFNFSIWNYDLVSNPDEFQNLIAGLYPEKQAHSALLFVHGFDNSFSEAAERLAQLTVDTDFLGDALLFSWPSDGRNTSFPTVTAYDYMRTAQIERGSRIYLVHAIAQLFTRSNGFINIVSHSMGTDLAVNAVLIRQDFLRRAGSPLQSEIVRSLVLAAPDISTREFVETMRPKLVNPRMRLRVYCSVDLALAASSVINHSDNRLGYCDKPMSPMVGVDIVIVRGAVQDFARHSYYLSAIPILDTLAKTIEGGSSLPSQTASDSAGTVSVIRLH